MPPRIRLVLALHNHQPIGNFDGVFAEAFDDSYAPFLEILAEFPQIPVCLHTSGSLLEWLEANRVEYLDAVAAFVERGQIEILGGPYYEPILANIPARDRVGQIRAYGEHLAGRFGVKPRGMWVPERVWEQSFTKDVADAGIEYAILDDYHFKAAGLRGNELFDYYLTEDEGRLVSLFPGDERLRYTIPFEDPQATIDYLRSVADRRPNSVVTFGDDGEKFGTWPGTHETVYKKGWLRRFLGALADNADWLKVTTLSEAHENVPPVGTIYVPDCSYREMTGWSLTTLRQTEQHDLVHAVEEEHRFGDVKDRLLPFIRGGFWRNFRVKYPEVNEMYCRMLLVSDRLAAVARRFGSDPHDDLEAARTHLYKAQCNCPFWHGAFGGLYLPHLRNAVYGHLIQADVALDRVEGRADGQIEATAEDYDLDARKEIKVSAPGLTAFLKPSRGGVLYEFDIHDIAHNLLATLDRRAEPYHEKIKEHAAKAAGGTAEDKVDSGEAVSIHDLVHFKQPGLDKKLIEDDWRRKAFVDHVLEPHLPLEDFMRGEGRIGDFATGVYETTLRHGRDRVEVVMTRTGKVTRLPVTVEKVVSAEAETPGELAVTYTLTDLPAGLPFHFAVECNFAGMAAGADDRFYSDASGDRFGQLGAVNDLSPRDGLSLTDEWLGLTALLETDKPAAFWTFPIETVSGSEAGFEAVHQSACVVARWQFTSPEDGTWRVGLRLKADTSLAKSRREETATVGV
ncbi:MAG: alpha-amylase/4-alpha-glucanotransferase domain-containing protein [Planctomycetota bacterium]